MRERKALKVQGWILSTILLALFRAKFACISTISNPVFMWDSCKGNEWDSVKKCLRVCKKNRDSRLDLAGDLRLQAARNYSRARHARSWSVTPAKALQDKIGQPAVQLPRGWNSWLSQVVRQSCEPALFWKNLTLHIPFSPQYKYPFYPRKKESFQREFWEKNPREKQDWFIPNLH